MWIVPIIAPPRNPRSLSAATDSYRTDRSRMSLQKLRSSKIIKTRKTMTRSDNFLRVYSPRTILKKKVCCRCTISTVERKASLWNLPPNSTTCSPTSLSRKPTGRVLPRQPRPPMRIWRILLDNWRIRLYRWVARPFPKKPTQAISAWSCKSSRSLGKVIKVSCKRERTRRFRIMVSGALTTCTEVTVSRLIQTEVMSSRARAARVSSPKFTWTISRTQWEYTSSLRSCNKNCRGPNTIKSSWERNDLSKCPSQRTRITRLQCSHGLLRAIRPTSHFSTTQAT